MFKIDYLENIMSELLQKWKNATTVLEEFDRWNNLPNGPKYRDSIKFNISQAHCVAPNLVRAGQQNCGGQNYWKTSKAVDSAILEWLVNNWDTVQKGVREILKDKEHQALLNCEQFVEEMQATIDNAKMQERYTRSPMPPSAPKTEDFDDDIPF